MFSNGHRGLFVLLVLHCSFYLMFVSNERDYGCQVEMCEYCTHCDLRHYEFISFSGNFYEFSNRHIRYYWLYFLFVHGYHCYTWMDWIFSIAYAIWGLEYLIRFSRLLRLGSSWRGKCRLFITTSKTVWQFNRSIEINHSGWWKPYLDVIVGLKYWGLYMFRNHIPLLLL